MIYNNSPRSSRSNPQCNHHHRSSNKPIRPEPQQMKTRTTKTPKNSKHYLSGADLYVVRIGRCGVSERRMKKKRHAEPVSTEMTWLHPCHDTAHEEPQADSRTVTDSILNHSSSSQVSLHDELMCRTRACLPTAPVVDLGHICDKSKLRASQPCDRCVLLMYHAGIRRVFWTTDDGEWVGGKLATLIEQHCHQPGHVRI